MIFRYDDIGRVFTQKEIDKQCLIDLEIMEFIEKLNPSTKRVIFNREIVGKVRDALIEIYSKDLKLCNERAFYP